MVGIRIGKIEVFGEKCYAGPERQGEVGLEGGFKHQEGRDEGRAGVLLKGWGLGGWLLPRREF